MPASDGDRLGPPHALCALIDTLATRIRIDMVAVCTFANFADLRIASASFAHDAALHWRASANSRPARSVML
jgi:hypothetical protein